MAILTMLAGTAASAASKMLKSGFNSTMFVHYAAEGDIAKMQSAINDGVDVNVKDPSGMPALNMAVENGHLSAVKFLLNNGAAVDITDKDGDTPLSRAIDHDNLEIAKLLIENGADLNVKDSGGWMPLWYKQRYITLNGLK